MSDEFENPNNGLFRLVMIMVEKTRLLVMVKVDFFVVDKDQSRMIVDGGLMNGNMVIRIGGLWWLMILVV